MPIRKAIPAALLALTLAALAGCDTTSAPPVASDNHPPVTGGPAGTPQVNGDCDASKVQDLVGKMVTSTLEQQAVKASGASQLRTLGPDDVATMDFNLKRLNIHTDKKKIIQRVTCG